MLKLLKLLGITQFLKFTQLNFSFGGLIGDLIGAAVGVATGGLGLGLDAAAGGALGGAIAGGVQSGNLSGAVTGGLAGYGAGDLYGLATGGQTGLGIATQGAAPTAEAGTASSSDILAGGSIPADTALTGAGGASVAAVTPDLAQLSAAAFDPMASASGDLVSGIGSGGYDPSLLAGSGDAAGGSVADVTGAAGGAGGTDLTWQQKLQQMFTGQNLNPFSSGGNGTGTGSNGLGTMGSLMQGGAGLMSLYNGYQLNQLAKGMQDPNTGMYQGLLANSIQNPSSYANTPSYQFQFGQGLQALGRTSAAAGYGGTGAAPGTGGGSGNFQTAATQYGQGMAQTGITGYQNMLAGLSKGNPAAINATNQAGNSNLMGMLMLSNAMRGG